MNHVAEIAYLNQRLSVFPDSALLHRHLAREIQSRYKQRRRHSPQRTHTQERAMFIPLAYDK